MYLCHLTLLLFLVVHCAFSNECPPNPITRFYKELGCEAIKEEGASCPTSYDCSKYESRDLTKCHHLGKVYSVGEEIDGIPKGSCMAACRCGPPMFGKGPPVFVCANVECPELFRRPDEGSRLLYKPDDCCSYRTISGADVETAVKCQYDNKTYVEDEKIYKDKKCEVCYCKENFDGPLQSSFCHEIQCHSELPSGTRINEGCVPIYYGRDGCCPIEWMCPEASNKVDSTKSKQDTGSSGSCKFGTLVLQSGEHLATDTTNTECTCLLPPYLTCIRS